MLVHLERDMVRPQGSYSCNNCKILVTNNYYRAMRAACLGSHLLQKPEDKNLLGIPSHSRLGLLINFRAQSLIRWERQCLLTPSPCIPWAEEQPPHSLHSNSLQHKVQQALLHSFSSASTSSFESFLPRELLPGSTRRLSPKQAWPHRIISPLLQPLQRRATRLASSSLGFCFLVTQRRSEPRWRYKSCLQDSKKSNPSISTCFTRNLLSQLSLKRVQNVIKYRYEHTLK